MYELKKNIDIRKCVSYRMWVFSNNFDKITLYKKSAIDLVIKKTSFLIQVNKINNFFLHHSLMGFFFFHFKSVLFGSYFLIN